MDTQLFKIAYTVNKVCDKNHNEILYELGFIDIITSILEAFLECDNIPEVYKTTYEDLLIQLEMLQEYENTLK